MSATSHRFSRCAMLAVTGVTVLGVAACGSSNTAGPTSAPAAPSSAAAPPATSSAPGSKARVSGLIASVSGSTAQVNQEKGTAAVAFTSSTKVTEVTPATLTDVTAGSCVTVRPAHDQPQPGQPVTAGSVRVSPAVTGGCPRVGAAADHPPLRGAVASVAGNTLTVTTTDASGAASQTPVTLTDKTRYTKQADTQVGAITQGKCLTAQGVRDDSGTLQATNINLRAARDGKCAGAGGPHHGHGG